jgi:hypothetical protein
MSEYIKVKDNPNLVRDKNSNAILNTDRNALDKYREEREYLLKVKATVDETQKLKQDMAETKKDINEIKQMLLQLMEKK